MLGRLESDDLRAPSALAEEAAAARSDVAITQTASPNPVRTGSNLTYTIQVTNYGPGPASSIVMTDTLPSATTFVSCSSTGGGACSGSGNVRRVSFSSLSKGTSATIILVATVKSTVADGALIQNRARVSSSDDSEPANNAATTTVTAKQPRADLVVTKGAAPNPVAPDSSIIYTVGVVNNGPEQAVAVTLTDTLPAAMTFVSCSASGGGVCAGSGNARTVSFSSLAAGTARTVTLVARVKSTVADGSVIGNTARARASSSVDPSLSNNAATASVTVRTFKADLSVVKGAAPNPVVVGSNLTYTITVANAGPDAASTVTLTDTLPASTTFLSCTSTTGGVCGGSGNVRTVSFSSLAAGASRSVTLVARVNATVADGSVIGNTARVRASYPIDPSLANNSATASVTARTLKADLSVANSAAPNPIAVGANLTYTITVTNAGPDPASAVTLTDTLPAATTFVSCSSTGAGVCGGSGNARTVSFSSLAGGASGTVTLVAKVNSTVADGTVIANVARVRAAAPADPSLANNSAAASVTVRTLKADLSVAKSAAPNPIGVGSNLTYTITVRNLGPVAASTVTLTDTLPAATTFVSCSSTSGGVCGGSGNARTVSFSSLAGGAFGSVTLVAKVKSTVADGSVIGNTARVRATSPSDPNLANNSATASVTARATGADLAVASTAAPNPVAVGSNVTYTITVTNNGPAAASTVTLTDTLPASTTFVSCSSTGAGVCGGSGNARTVSFSSLAAGISGTVTLVTKVKSTVADGTVIANIARVRAVSPTDPGLANNSATASVTARATGADLAVASTAAPNPVAVGSNLTYTITVTNNGPAAASTVTLTDTLPASTTFVSCSSTGAGVCGGSGNARTVSFSSLAAGISGTVTLVTKVKSTVADGTVIANIARVRAVSPTDPGLANNSATASATARATGADLTVANTAAPNPVVVGSNVTYTITVTNNGPAAASTVTLTDTLPATTSFVSCSSSGGGACGGSSNARTVSFSSLAAGASASVTLVATVKSTVADGTVIGNTGRVRATSPTDPAGTNNAAVATVTATTGPRSGYHVSTSGSDGNPGTADRPFRNVHAAVDVVSPGDTIWVHPGTYTGMVSIWKSGTAAKPIVLRSVSTGAATLTASFPTLDCSNLSPTHDRTIRVAGGADHWIIQGFVIQNGILIVGTNLSGLTDADVRDRSLPGRGLYDLEAARTTLESLGSDGADGIRILNNVIRGRGILTAAARRGRIEGNEIANIACGTGGGIWLGRFSDEWTVRNNRIHDIAASTYHTMTEGIRLGSASMYNVIENNVIERALGPGRGVSSDVNSGWNVFKSNTVREVEVSFSEQLGAWGNSWLYNISEDSRRAGYIVYSPLSSPTTPNDKVPRYLTLRCNQSRNDPTALILGWLTESTMEKNDVPTVVISPNLRNYWPSSGNTWDGSTNPPPANPSNTSFSSC